MPLLEFNDNGLYCPAAGIYIDPLKPVSRALITHGHADHARWGHKSYLCTHQAKPTIKYRLGHHISIESVAFGESVNINGVQFSFHPAGHICGSAQIRVEHKGEVWVASGDYKLEDDGLAEAFELVPCHTFISECTFGLPVFDWSPQEEAYAAINAWWQTKKSEGQLCFLQAYSLGKAQRLLQGLDGNIGKIYAHPVIENVNEILRKQGYKIPKIAKINQHTTFNNIEKGSIILVPPGVERTLGRKFKFPKIGIASGWMAVPEIRESKNADGCFVLSDHCDFKGLVQTIKETKAETVLLNHGFTNSLAAHLTDIGINAIAKESQYTGGLAEASLLANDLMA